MKRTMTSLLIAAALGLAISSVQAQKIVLTSGALDFLKGETALNVEYVYDGMAVGKFASEQDYIDKKVAEYNQKEPGRGDKWREAWKADRANRFQPKFEELINKQLADRRLGLRIGANKDAKYTLIFKTTFTETGWNVAVMRRPALINAEASFVETANRGKQLALVTLTKAPGRDFWGFDYDTGGRLSEAYAKAGKSLGIYIWKKTK
jgi:hypothetical protein